MLILAMHLENIKLITGICNEISEKITKNNYCRDQRCKIGIKVVALHGSWFNILYISRNTISEWSVSTQVRMIPEQLWVKINRKKKLTSIITSPNSIHNDSVCQNLIACVCRECFMYKRNHFWNSDWAVVIYMLLNKKLFSS